MSRKGSTTENGATTGLGRLAVPEEAVEVNGRASGGASFHVEESERERATVDFPSRGVQSEERDRPRVQATTWSTRASPRSSEAACRPDRQGRRRSLFGFFPRKGLLGWRRAAPVEESGTGRGHGTEFARAPKRQTRLRHLGRTRRELRQRHL